MSTWAIVPSEWDDEGGELLRKHVRCDVLIEVRPVGDQLQEVLAPLLADREPLRQRETARPGS